MTAIAGITTVAWLLAAASSSPAGGAPAEPSLFRTPGLVARWSFQDAPAGVVRDLAGDDNGGTYHGEGRAALVAGPFGAHALAFLEAGQKVTGPDRSFPTGAQPGSISLWFNRPPGVDNKVLFSYGSQKRGAARGLWIVNEKRLCFYFWGHPLDLHCDVKGGVTPDQWHHLAATYDGGTARLYYDGRQIGQVAVVLATELCGHFQMGANLRYDDGRDFLGLLDQVAVFGRALTADEIRDYYAAHAGELRRLSEDDRLTYHAACREVEAARAVRLRAAVRELGLREIVFAVRQVDTDSHWYANFGYNVNDPERRRYYHDGGRLCRLDLDTGEATTLLHDPNGGVRDPQVHYDGAKVLFSYRRGGQPFYHLHEINIDGTGLRRLTDGPFDDIEPTYLPDGGIVFCSSRCKRWVPCYYTQVAVLYRCEADGRGIRQLSANVEHENTPWVLPDGRILYQRWEYVDRSQVGYHHLWTMNPDGTGQMVFYGNMHANTVMIDAKPIPGTRKVVASFSPGHGRNEHAGVITVVDPGLGPDARSMVRSVSRGRLCRDPYPLTEDCLLAAGETEIRIMDGRGRSFPVFELPAEWRHGRMKVHEPRPLRARPRERVIPPRVDLARTTGSAYLEDVYAGRNMVGVERGEIKELLVLEVLPKPCNMFSGMEPLSYGGTFLLERVLGTVPVEPDGSAHFELPAMRSVFFVALDNDGSCVKRMQSFMTVQPGEVVGCVGCHESRTRPPVSRMSRRAVARPPSAIQPIPGVPAVFDFPRDIQPILDRHCVVCHGYKKTARGGPMSGGMILSGDRGPMFSHSYIMLLVGRQVSDGRNLRKSNYPPRGIGSSASPLLKKLDGGHHDVRATGRDKRLVQLWIDTGAVYAGTYAALGSGSLGDYSGSRPARPDAGWASTNAAQEVLRDRCSSCHKAETRLPSSPSDNRGLVPWGEREMNHLARTESQRRNPAFRFSRHILYNLSQPARSLLLLAPLAKAAGGYGTCPVEGAPEGGGVFGGTEDPGYRVLLGAIREAKAYLETIKRFDMPGFRPRKQYVREMKRFGILPETFRLDGSPVDVYKLERAYWASLAYRPHER